MQTISAYLFGDAYFLIPNLETSVGISYEGPIKIKQSAHVTDDEIGQQIVRLLPYSKRDTKAQPDFKVSQDELIKLAGVKRKRDFFGFALYCIIVHVNGELVIRPTKAMSNLGRYEGLPNGEELRIPFESSPEEIGATFRKAMAKCLPHLAKQ